MIAVVAHVVLGIVTLSSGKFEGVRWACGLIKNLAKAEDNAALFGQVSRRFERPLH